ncbi:DNAse I-like superfamily protein [Striga asiatica]|uniref:DNAse I-like superfamily protein n=1 Tax=Striga asiatica TaxID=4170 RepID=A0A5A7QRM5_STRAF|nr:DNAse I-like superfamily protein [Striga asiatica]
MDFCDNFGVVDHGRITIIWNPSKADLVIGNILPQSISATLTCKLWRDLECPKSLISISWLLLRDFNMVLRPEEKINGELVTNRDFMDLADFCDKFELVDIPSSGFFHIWTNSTICYKLDRAMVDDRWFQAGFYSQANFLAPGRELRVNFLNRKNWFRKHN